MANDVLSHFRITADAADAQKNVGGLSGSFGSLFGVITGGVASGNLLSGALSTITGGISSAARAIGGFISSSMQMNASLESSTLQFTTLMGNADQAREHVKFLFEFAKTTPFETGPIIEASRIMQTFGGSALNSRENLRLFGDAAAATSAPIQEVAMWSGRLYAALQAGRPFGEAAQRLGELAIMTPQARGELEKMQKAGASGTEIWAKYQESLGRFDGAMVRMAGTWSGLTSSISDTLSIMAAQAFEPFFAAAKESLAGILDFLGDKGVEGAVKNFGMAAMTAFTIAREALGPLITSIVTLGKNLTATANTGSFVESSVRGIVGIMAVMVKTFAGVIDAVSFVIKAYSEFRIAMNLAAIAVLSVVSSVTTGVMKLRELQAMLSWGEVRKRFQEDVARMRAETTQLGKEIDKLGIQNAKYQQRTESVDRVMGGFTESLRKAATQMGETAENFKFVAVEEQAVTTTTSEATQALEDMGSTATETGGKVNAFAETTTKNLKDLALAWHAQPAAIQQNRESIDILLAKYAELRAKVTDPSALPKDLEALYLQFTVTAQRADQLAAAIPKATFTFEQMRNTARGLTYDGLIPMEKATADLMKAMTLATPPIVHAGQATKDLADRNAEARESAVKLANEGIRHLATTLNELAQIAPASMKGMLSGISAGVSAFSSFQQGISSVKTGWTQTATAFAPGGAGIVGMLGGLASMASGIGAVVAAASLAYAGLKKMFGVSDEEKKGRISAAEFRTELERGLTTTQKLEAGTEKWKREVIRMRDAYIAAGKTEQDALDASKRLWEAEKKGPEAVRKVIDEIRIVMELAEIQQRQMTNSAVHGFDEVSRAGDELINKPIVIPIVYDVPEPPVLRIPREERVKAPETPEPSSGVDWSDESSVRAWFLKNNPEDEDRWEREVKKEYGFQRGGIATKPQWRWFAEQGNELAMPLPDFNRLIDNMGRNMLAITAGAAQAFTDATARVTEQAREPAVREENHFTFEIHAMDSSGVREVIEQTILPEFVAALRKGRSLSDLKGVLDLKT
jgi:hypothetical protein